MTKQCIALAAIFSIFPLAFLEEIGWISLGALLVIGLSNLIFGIAVLYRG